MSQWTLQTPPFPSEIFRQTAIIHCLSFSNRGLSRWWATSPELAITDTVDQIPARRMHKTIRDHLHRQLNPKSIVVCAIMDRKVVGYVVWTMPKKLWRNETLAELIYRKVVKYKDALEDWLFPSFWYDQGRRDQFHKAQEDCMEKFLGPGSIDEMWYLKVLTVHPEYQRGGVGAALIDWGLEHARERGEKAYLEATSFGKGLYLKKGFTTVGELSLGAKADELSLACMLWDPAAASSCELNAQLIVPQPVETQT